MSLRKNEEGIYTWIPNYEGLMRDYPLLCAALDNLGDKYNRPASFVRRQQSSFVSKKGEDSIRNLFTKSDIVTVEGAGHWVHFDKT